MSTLSESVAEEMIDSWVNDMELDIDLEKMDDDELFVISKLLKRLQKAAMSGILVYQPEEETLQLSVKTKKGEDLVLNFAEPDGGMLASKITSTTDIGKIVSIAAQSCGRSAGDISGLKMRYFKIVKAIIELFLL